MVLVVRHLGGQIAMFDTSVDSDQTGRCLEEPNGVSVTEILFFFLDSRDVTNPKIRGDVIESNQMSCLTTTRFEISPFWSGVRPESLSPTIAEKDRFARLARSTTREDSSRDEPRRAETEATTRRQRPPQPQQHAFRQGSVLSCASLALSLSVCGYIQDSPRPSLHSIPHSCFT